MFRSEYKFGIQTVCIWMPLKNKMAYICPEFKWHPTSFQPFEYWTSLVFRSLLYILFKRKMVFVEHKKVVYQVLSVHQQCNWKKNNVFSVCIFTFKSKRRHRLTVLAFGGIWLAPFINLRSRYCKLSATLPVWSAVYALSFWWGAVCCRSAVSWLRAGWWGLGLWPVALSSRRL